MELNKLPGLRILFFILIPILGIKVFDSEILVGFVLILVFGFLTVFSSFKSAIGLTLISVLTFIALNSKEKKDVPYGYCQVVKVLKENKREFQFIGEGEHTILFKGRSSKDKISSFMEGDVIKVNDRFVKKSPPKSLVGFNYREYLDGLGVDSICYLSTKSELTFRNASQIALYSKGVKNWLINHFQSFKGLSEESVGFLIAITTGDKSYVPYELKVLFRDSGVMHVLAISGLHVGILFLTISFLLNTVLRVGKKTALVLIVTILLGYMVMSGLSPSVVRATLMFSFIQIGKSFNKNVSSLNIVLICGSLMLFWDAELLFNIGFQLSFSAVIGILLVINVSFLKSIKVARWLTPIWNLFKVNLGAFLFTAPILLYHFHELNFTSFYASFIIVPLISVSMCLALMIIFFAFSTKITDVFVFLFSALFEFIEWLLAIIVENLRLSCRFWINEIRALFMLSALVLILTKKRIFVYVTIVIALIGICNVDQTKVYCLAKENEIQLKIKDDLFLLKVGDELLTRNSKITFKAPLCLVYFNDNMDTVIDFSVEKYQTLMLEF